MGFPLFAVRVHRAGNSLCIRIPKDMLQQLGIHLGDMLAIRVHAPYATLTCWPLNKLAPLGDVDVEALPPRDPMKLGRDARSR